MTQYLVTTFKDSTGRKHTHITRAKSNQRFTVVEAESKEKAKIEDDFIKEINDKESEFYSPMMANMNEHELRTMLRMMPSLIDTGDDNDD
ncbi:DUF7366 family protein [Staphylococcus aureus]|uniref:DUF7366 family protein n=1 Tax=Staphylococcus aureus TaxID=1280 RepID=UPI0033109140|nr:DUF1381 domain-containing protein [Staphylococcus aureus]HDG8618176.1 DUF1381 domain-containing protein [Staphylococcus aureus]HDG8641802.1 DUF1381 domain-containing protein [Staphylococcus aureus]HDG8644429.1 DUF1381 domain-containing protein [Staphylococcus aureus]HDG8668594.1 DUF1381 domain-containing protein [Staphylococcus aureus]